MEREEDDDIRMHFTSDEKLENLCLHSVINEYYRCVRPPVWL